MNNSIQSNPKMFMYPMYVRPESQAAKIEHSSSLQGIKSVKGEAHK